jgi:hypothetical protein
MVATGKKTITIGKWRAVPNGDGYDIHAPGMFDTFRGYANSEKVAIKWLEDSSGLTYQRLPELKRSDITVKEGPRQGISKFPYRKNDTFQHTFYFLGEQLLGSIQTKVERGRTTLLTCCGDSGICGSDLRWICEQNGLRLVD